MQLSSALRLAALSTLPSSCQITQGHTACLQLPSRVLAMLVAALPSDSGVLWERRQSFSMPARSFADLNSTLIWIFMAFLCYSDLACMENGSPQSMHAYCPFLALLPHHCGLLMRWDNSALSQSAAVLCIQRGN